MRVRLKGFQSFRVRVLIVRALLWLVSKIAPVRVVLEDR